MKRMATDDLPRGLGFSKPIVVVLSSFQRSLMIHAYLQGYNFTASDRKKNLVMTDLSQDRVLGVENGILISSIKKSMKA